MTNKPQKSWLLLKESMLKTIGVCLLFLLLNSTQQHSFIRENVEDVAFDFINKYQLSTEEQSASTDGNSNLVSIYAFDNEYMRREGLFDEKNIANYGYTFPRSSIATFINRLDKVTKKLAQGTPPQCPKALFIDFDLSFPSGAGLQLSQGDDDLLKALGKERCYTILLAMTSPQNYIKDYATDTIQKLITKGKAGEKGGIIFVSPFFHISSDDTKTVRRYTPTKIIGGETYPTAAIALWKISKQEPIYITEIKKDFPNPVSTDKVNKINVTRNNIFIKKYKNFQQGNKCLCQQVSQSYWAELNKYSLGCLKEESDDFSFSPATLPDRILMLGGTDRPAYGLSDYHNTLMFFNAEKMSGVDLHANTLMTLFYFDKNQQKENKAPTLKELPNWISLLIIFTVYLIADYFFALLLASFKKANNKAIACLAFLIQTRIPLVLITSWLLYKISLAFLHGVSLPFLAETPPLWFNYIIVWISYQIFDGLAFVTKKYFPRLIKIVLSKIIGLRQYLWAFLLKKH